MMKKLDLISKQKDNYSDRYLNEIGVFLQNEYGVNSEMIGKLLGKFNNILRKDPSYVFHYDSEYWAKYIVEVSGVMK